MTRPELFPLLGDVIAAIGSESFPGALAGFLRSIAPFTYTVVFGYRGAGRPLDLHDDFPAGKRKIFVTDYQEGPYLLDPFYLASARPVPAGLYRMRDLAPDRFYQGEYFRSYYVQTGLAEEIGFFVDMPDAGMIVLSLMRAERVFSAREFRALEEVRPVVEPCLRRHWSDLAQRFDGSVAGRDERRLQRQIERSFLTFGDNLLTPREREISEYTLKGHSAEAIGKLFGISPGTVRIHRRNIYGKLHISSQGELFSKFIETLSSSR
ncbi:MAG: helix-turn-helix transcriptional regulator [Rhodobacteraceae bacterium]|nr:helix-turn-helix transcriptional regulator [Paracoccaceae bacterium]